MSHSLRNLRPLAIVNLGVNNLQVLCRTDSHLATPALAATARSAAIYKDQRFSDHAPLTIEYDGLL